MLHAQQDLSLSDDIAGRLPAGSKLLAVWSEDGEWYAVSPWRALNSMFFVVVTLGIKR
jgi:hypothetical protein